MRYIRGEPARFAFFITNVELQQNRKHTIEFGGEAVDAFGQLEAIERLEKGKMLSHEAGLAALHVTNDMPFYRKPQRLYRSLRFQFCYFLNGFFGIIFAEDLRTDGGLHNFKRLQFGHHHQPHGFRLTPGFAR